MYVLDTNIKHSCFSSLTQKNESLVVLLLDTAKKMNSDYLSRVQNPFRMIDKPEEGGKGRVPQWHKH